MVFGTILIIGAIIECEYGIDYDDKGTPTKIAKILYVIGNICLLGGFWLGI